MRIAQVATLSTPVKRVGSGSIESLVWTLSRELTRSGHQVTVFGCAGSAVEGRLVETVAGPHGAPDTLEEWYLAEWINLCRAVEASAQFDIIHTHAYLWGMPLEALSKCPLLHTLHLTPLDNQARLWRSHPMSHVSAISSFQWSSYPDLAPVAVVPHGVNIEDFIFSPEAGEYLLYLGRFMPGKGPLEAVLAAKRLALRLILAGPRNGYLDEILMQHVDGDQIKYVGPVNGSARAELLAGARVLVYPIQDPEPFGLTLIEAMLSGTPPAAFGIGAAAEIIDNGVSGVFVGPGEPIDTAILSASALDRWKVRDWAAKRFCGRNMAKNYFDTYSEILK